MRYSSFSVMRKRIGVKAYSDIYHELLKEYFGGKQLSLIFQDSTDIPAFSLKDKDAKFGQQIREFHVCRGDSEVRVLRFPEGLR